jgi:hypothetical protein
MIFIKIICMSCSDAFEQNIVRFDVADFLHMPEDSAVFATVLDSFASDDLWDKTDKLQAAYSMAKLKRYNLEAVQASYSKSTYMDKDKEVIASSTAKDNMNAFDSGASSSSTTGMIPVKIEYPLAVAFNGQVSILKAAKSIWIALAAFVSDLDPFTFVSDLLL